MELKILFHIDEVENWKKVCGNIKNTLKEELKGEYTFKIEIVATSDAVLKYVPSSVEDDDTQYLLEEFSKKNVTIVACNNALNHMGIDSSKLYPFITVVPAGIIEISLKQQLEGYSYIKP